MNSAQGLIDRLKLEIHQTLSPVLAAYDSYVLFDFPDYDNIGDSAIYLGEIEYLKQNHSIPAYVCRADQCNYKRVATEFKDALILIQGGGNFGDLYPWHHQRKEQLLQYFKGRRIVQLPQTIHFASPEALNHTASTIKQHGAFTLFVRDHKSFDFARTEFDCEVIACPDMAFWMGPQDRHAEPIYDLLMLLRVDAETSPKRGLERLVGSRDVKVVDWEDVSKPVRAARKITALFEVLRTNPKLIGDLDELRHTYFNLMAKTRIERGLKLLSSGDFLITDRLHAYILAILLDIPRTVLDNSYGKLSTFIDTWMQDADHVPTFNQIDDAIANWERRVA